MTNINSTSSNNPNNPTNNPAAEEAEANQELDNVVTGFSLGEHRELLPRTKLQSLVNEVAPGEVLSPEVEEFLQEHADEFIENITDFACKLAKHRKSKILESRDIQLYLDKNWNLRVPGYGDDPRPIKRPMIASIHNARLQEINKAQQNLVKQPPK